MGSSRGLVFWRFCYFKANCVFSPLKFFVTVYRPPSIKKHSKFTDFCWLFDCLRNTLNFSFSSFILLHLQFIEQTCGSIFRSVTNEAVNVRRNETHIHMQQTQRSREVFFCYLKLQNGISEVETSTCFLRDAISSALHYLGH